MVGAEKPVAAAAEGAVLVPVFRSVTVTVDAETDALKAESASSASCKAEATAVDAAFSAIATGIKRPPKAGARGVLAAVPPVSVEADNTRAIPVFAKVMLFPAVPAVSAVIEITVPLFVAEIRASPLINVVSSEMLENSFAPGSEATRVKTVPLTVIVSAAAGEP